MKRRKPTQPGFATTAHVSPGQPGRPDSHSEIPDPVCSKTCGSCWACLRKKYGPQYWAKGVTK